MGGGTQTRGSGKGAKAVRVLAAVACPLESGLSWSVLRRHQKELRRDEAVLQGVELVCGGELV